MGFKPGQEVVCVNGNFDMSDPDFKLVFPNLPKEGSIYTIREYEAPSVKLEEIVNPEVPMDFAGITMMEEGAFHESRFRILETLSEVQDEEMVLEY